MKVIISAALTGAWPKKETNPALPYTPGEIAQSAYECWQAGAAIVHLHMRDQNGEGTMRKELFAETCALIRDRCDVVLNLTTSGDLRATDETRMEHLALVKPEMCSYDCGTMNWGHNDVFMNSPQFLEKLGLFTIEHGVKPEIEIFDGGMIYNSLYYMKKGFIEPPPHYQFVLGAPGGLDATVGNLVFLRERIPQNATWSAFGIGKSHLPIMYATLAMDGHVRVGLEDNLYYAPKELAKSNAQLVERAVRVMAEMHRSPASPDEAREMLGLARR